MASRKEERARSRRGALQTRARAPHHNLSAPCLSISNGRRPPLRWRRRRRRQQRHHQPSPAPSQPPSQRARRRRPLVATPPPPPPSPPPCPQPNLRPPPRRRLYPHQPPRPVCRAPHRVARLGRAPRAALWTRAHGRRPSGAPPARRNHRRSHRNHGQSPRRLPLTAVVRRRPRPHSLAARHGRRR